MNTTDMNDAELLSHAERVIQELDAQHSPNEEVGTKRFHLVNIAHSPTGKAKQLTDKQRTDLLALLEQQAA